jgi:hypothetical protein
MADWNPGRSHWWTTTAIAIIGAIVGGTSLVINFFYRPCPPPTTVDSSHSEFMKLSYSDRVDRCLLHIEEHFDEWRTALTDAGTSQLKAPIGYAPFDDSEATGQAIVNSHAVGSAQPLDCGNGWWNPVANVCRPPVVQPCCARTVGGGIRRLTCVGLH